MDRGQPRLGSGPGQGPVLRRLLVRLVLGHLPAAVHLARGLRAPARREARPRPAAAPGTDPAEPGSPAGVRRRRPGGRRTRARGGRPSGPGVAEEEALPRPVPPRGGRRVGGCRARLPAGDREHPVPPLPDRGAGVHGLRLHDQVHGTEDHRGGGGLRQQPRLLRLLHPRHVLRRRGPAAVLPDPGVLRGRVRASVPHPLRPAPGLHGRHAGPRGRRGRARGAHPQGEPPDRGGRRQGVPRGQRLRARGHRPGR